MRADSLGRLWHDRKASMRARRIPLPICVLGLVLALIGPGCGRNSGTQTLPSATPSSPASPANVKAPSDPLIVSGARAYERYCALCHAKDGSGYAADNAPSLISKTFLESATDEFIAAGIRLGRPNTAMAAYGKVRGGPLEELEINAIVRFLRAKGPKALPLPPAAASGNAKRGEELFTKECVTCHGSATTRGNALNLHNPELLNAASPAFLRYAIINGRPPTPMPAFQGKLAEQDVSDVVHWLWSFKPALPTAPVANLTVPDDLPIVINPKGGKPRFKLRDERFVASEQVKNALAAKQRIVIVDARSPSDWIQFRIPGAISLPYHDRSSLDRIPNDGTWVVAYCACPHHASGEVVDALRAKKYPNTAILDEGILFWKNQGYPLIGEAVTAAAAGSAKAPVGAKPPATARPPGK
jgi:cytochrome c oxidase cbb3-type subunit 3/ubiquinol-cytochrome c reductase cytochrome c subunit